MNLPGWVSAALEEKLEGVSRRALAERAERMSVQYRAQGGSEGIRTEADALAYALTRMPATYAAVRRALAEAVERLPELHPRTLLDVGAGPGTASWAAQDAWDSLEEIRQIDRNQALLGLVATIGAKAAGTRVEPREGRLPEALQSAAKADVAVASYALAEFAVKDLDAVLSGLWSLAEKALVVVEPGTPEGFRRVLKCREWLLAAGARVVAPCTHAGPCPLAQGARWCHFSQRLSRSRDHQRVKAAEVNYEDEKFCYLIAARADVAEASAVRRVLATPRVTKTEIRVVLCAPEQVEERGIARRDKELYKQARHWEWGEAARC